MEIEGARLYVDLLSFQDFSDPVGHLDRWYKESGMPVLWANGANRKKIPDCLVTRNDGEWYSEVLEGLR
ncbi:MAG: hypothetical protein O7C75_20560 [Verrucomicrobia bacterium]|nr:hypothetical protein [Verrucomicrobiota bacterium]